MFLLGITGNIATGKSVVTGILRELGVDVIDSDELVHELYWPGSPIVNEIVHAFGSGVIGPEGGVDRTTLGRLVFGEPEALRTLESIVWPAVAKLRDEQIARSEADVIALDAVKLMESGFAEKCDSVWLITADPDIQLERLIQNRHMDANQARARLASQPDVSWKKTVADHVIENNGTLDDLRERVINTYINTVPAELQSRIPRRP